MTAGDLDMRKVMMLGWADDESSQPVKVDRGEAMFHCFSTDSCLEGCDVLTWPAAIVELPNGEVITLHAEFIRFVS